MGENQGLSEGKTYVRRAKCPVCQSYLDEAGVCSYCATKRLASEKLKGVFGFVAGLLGFDPPDGFNARSFFSGIFRRHSEDELEEHLSRGLTHAIPAVDGCSLEWPSPWLFTRFLLLAVAASLMAHLGLSFMGGLNLRQVPTVIIVDCALLPLAMTLFYFEMNVRRSISLALMAGLFVVGGVVSIMFTALIQPAFMGAFDVGWLGMSGAGLTEEPAKLLAVLVFAKAVRRRPYILDGLAMGAAVGAGFAVFESCGYAFEIFVGAAVQTQNAAVSYSTMMGNILIRALISPFMHVTWTAITAAGLFYVKGSARLRCNMLIDPRFLRVFVFAVAMHMFWNSTLLLNMIDVKILIMLGVSITVMFTLIAAGIKQIRKEREYCQAHPGVVEDGMEWVPAVREQAERAAAEAPAAAVPAEVEAPAQPKATVTELNNRRRKTAFLWLAGLVAFWLFCDRQANGRWMWDDEGGGSAPSSQAVPNWNPAPAPNGQAPAPAVSGQESWSGRLRLYQLVAEWSKGNRAEAYEIYERDVYPLLEKAYNDDVPDAVGDYGMLLYMGVFHEQNQQEGLAELRRAAQLGSVEAANVLKQFEQTGGR